MRSYLTGMGPKSRDDVLIRGERHKHTEDEGHLMTEVEIAVMQLQVKDFQ